MKGSTRASKSVAETGKKRKIIGINALHEILGRELREQETNLYGQKPEGSILLERTLGSRPGTAKIWRSTAEELATHCPLERIEMEVETSSGFRVIVLSNLVSNPVLEQINEAFVYLQTAHRTAVRLADRDSSISSLRILQAALWTPQTPTAEEEKLLSIQSLVASSVASLWGTVGADPFTYSIPDGYQERLVKALRWLQSFGGEDLAISRENVLATLLGSFDEYLGILHSWDVIPKIWWTPADEESTGKGQNPYLPIYDATEAGKLAEQWDVYSILLVALNSALGKNLLDITQCLETVF